MIPRGRPRSTAYTREKPSVVIFCHAVSVSCVVCTNKNHCTRNIRMPWDGSIELDGTNNECRELEYWTHYYGESLVVHGQQRMWWCLWLILVDTAMLNATIRGATWSFPPCYDGAFGWEESKEWNRFLLLTPLQYLSWQSTQSINCTFRVGGSARTFIMSHNSSWSMEQLDGRAASVMVRCGRLALWRQIFGWKRWERHWYTIAWPYVLGTLSDSI